jgi:hypothetical protein
VISLCAFAVEYAIFIFFIGCYAEMPLGLFLLRGDNIVLFGEMEESNEEKEHLEKQGIKLQKVTVEELQERKKTAQDNLDWDLE